LKLFSLIAAFVLGLVAGVFSLLVFWMVDAGIYDFLQPHILPPRPSNDAFSLFAVGLFAIWLVVIWIITWRMGRGLNFVSLFLVVLPLPSVVGLCLFAAGHDNPGHRSDLTVVPNRGEAKGQQSLAESTHRRAKSQAEGDDFPTRH
jgi:hypothetical protein